jgi:hypothetical protein
MLTCPHLPWRKRLHRRPAATASNPKQRLRLPASIEIFGKR